MNQYTMIYTKETQSIEVSVRPLYNKEHSAPKNNLYVWSYNIRIKNNGEVTAQLLNRYWKIINQYGKIEEVRGPGVIGLHPVIRPFQIFEYSSFTHLDTSTGQMLGHYEMLSEKGEYFTIDIPAFDLMLPVQLVTVH